MMHLTYNRRNMIGDGCGEPGNAGLSDFGRAVVREMNRVGVIADVAHSSRQTGFDAAEESSVPIVSSHAICTALNDHCRSKPDDLIRAIADTGGYAGICCIPHFLGGSGDINAFLDHIDHVVKNFGADYAAIGTDVAYSAQATEEETAKILHPPKARQRWEALWPEGSMGVDNPQYNDPKKRLSMAWTNWPMFTVGMVQRGYSDDDIQKVLGGNVLRVARAVLDGREKL
jgi:membrane dipeptidase